MLGYTYLTLKGTLSIHNLTYGELQASPLDWRSETYNLLNPAIRLVTFLIDLLGFFFIECVVSAVGDHATAGLLISNLVG